MGNIELFISSLTKEDHNKFQQLLRTDPDLCTYNWDSDSEEEEKDISTDSEIDESKEESEPDD